VREPANDADLDRRRILRQVMQPCRAGMMGEAASTLALHMPLGSA
jgi:hypothetical protein